MYKSSLISAILILYPIHVWAGGGGGTPPPSETTCFPQYKAFCTLNCGGQTISIELPSMQLKKDIETADNQIPGRGCSATKVVYHYKCDVDNAKNRDITTNVCKSRECNPTDNACYVDCTEPTPSPSFPACEHIINRNTINKTTQPRTTTVRQIVAVYGPNPQCPQNYSDLHTNNGNTFCYGNCQKGYTVNPNLRSQCIADCPLNTIVNPNNNLQCLKDCATDNIHPTNETICFQNCQNNYFIHDTNQCKRYGTWSKATIYTYSCGSKEANTNMCNSMPFTFNNVETDPLKGNLFTSKIQPKKDDEGMYSCPGYSNKRLTCYGTDSAYKCTDDNNSTYTASGIDSYGSFTTSCSTNLSSPQNCVGGYTTENTGAKGCFSCVDKTITCVGCTCTASMCVTPCC